MPRRTAIVVMAAVALAFAGAAAPPADARSSQATLFEAPRELLSADAELRARTLDEITSLGAGWVRIILYWNRVAPQADSPRIPSFEETDPAQYDWGAYDAAIQEARARGLRVLLTVSGPVPRWATREREDHLTRPSPRRFGRFVTAVARRYGTIVSRWSIWNEPNHPDFLRPQWVRRNGSRDAESGRIYRRLFQEAERGLDRAGHGRAPVYMGETAPRGTGKVVHPLIFLRRALCLDVRWRKARGCGRLPASGYAHHAYTTRGGPWFRPPSRNDVTIGVLGRLNSALARAGRAGAVRKGMPIYLTEFGIQSKPDPFLGVSETAQAEYRSISERIAYRNPRVRMFSQYLMRDDAPTTDGNGETSYGGFESGLRDHTGNAKRAYEGFRLPLVALRGSKRATLWGLVRPATGATRVSIDYRAKGSSRWRLLKRDRTNGRGYWTTTTSYRSGRRYRVRWTAPDGTRYEGPLTRVYDR